MKKYTKEEAKKAIIELVEQFEASLIYYKSNNYVEAQVENDFIKPFFECLNWNVSNKGLSPNNQEFIVQVKNKTQDTESGRYTKPDYLLRIPEKNSNYMKSVFFIEAKSPHQSLKSNVKHLRQVYQYAFSTLNKSDNPNNQVRLALLTDFEEFRFFDCQDGTPLVQNTANAFNKHIIKDWTYKDYVGKFDELWEIFEFNNVVNGSLDKWHLTSKQPAENRITPDNQFLDDLKKWRLEIAKSMLKNNKELKDFQITEATLLFINRIIFIKMLADRNIEPDYLQNILDSLNKSTLQDVKLYELCKNVFITMEHIYNGSIFNKNDEYDILEIENIVLKKIFEELDVEKSIYTLAAMPVEIIGNIYELLIAEKIVKKGRGLEIVPKYDEKKAGGVYYTPRYIVEYIVDNTLGKKLEECKTVEDIEKIKILDPACGSGSFLIVAYQKLLDWYKKYLFEELQLLVNNKEHINYKEFAKRAKNIHRYENYFDENNNDYHKISLTHKQKSRILENCIFGVDIDAQAVMVTAFSLSLKALEDSTIDEIKTDNEIFNMPILPKLDNNIKCGNSLIASDFYIDNKPSLFKEKEKRKINTFDWDGKDGFPEIIKKGGFDVVIGNPPYVRYENLNYDLLDYFTKNFKTARNFFDLFQLFIEKSIVLLKNNGMHGFIIPNLYLKGMNYKESRKFYIENTTIEKIINHGDNVFSGVKMPTCILISKKSKNELNLIEYAEKKNNFHKIYIRSDIFKNKDFIFSNLELTNKIEINKLKLEDLVNIQRGLEIGKDEKIDSKLNATKLLFGDDIKRYLINNVSYIENSTFNEFKKNDKYFKVEKIIIRETGIRITATYDKNKLFTNRSLYSIVLKEKQYNLFYLLGLINSNLIQYYYFSKFKADTDVFPKIRIGQVKSIPIPNINFSIKSEKEKHDKLVQLVEKMLENQNLKNEAKTEREKKLYSNICDTLDKQIDKLVYELYELTEEEIKIVEGE